MTTGSPHAGTARQYCTHRAAVEKLEIIRLVEQSRLPVRRTLDKLGILPARFYRWYDRYQSGGYEALKDRPPRPKQAWNRIPDDVRGRVLRLALDAPALSPRELATRFIDTAKPFLDGPPRSSERSTSIVPPSPRPAIKPVALDY